MYSLSDNARSIGESANGIKGRSFGSGFAIDPVQQTIDKANKISLLDLLNKYNLKIDPYNKKACCPFHSGGRERTPSFYFYEDTNSFFCFGCKVSGGPVDFLAMSAKITQYAAAQALLNDYSVVFEADEKSFNDSVYILEFSNAMREFIIKHNKRPEAIKFAEKNAEAFDFIRNKHSLEEKDLSKLLEKIKNKLENYECQAF